MLDQIRVVLSHTQHPGNIGAVARAMRTMGLSDLRLVNPREAHPHPDARARSKGGLDILLGAQVHASLTAAIEGCRTVIGTSARGRGLNFEVLNPRQLSERLRDRRDALPAAILFGCEANGLSNDELGLCNSHVYIPANPDYSSLNLGSAVQIIAYELRMAAFGGAVSDICEPGDLLDAPAPAEHMDMYFAHMREQLLRIEFMKPTASEKLFGRLRRLYLRAQPTVREANILHGILKATNEALDGTTAARHAAKADSAAGDQHPSTSTPDAE